MAETLKPGQRLGPYQIEGLVDTGGMGEVYKARDVRVDRIVALKRLHAEHVNRFRQEAKAIAALNHPHICQLYDVGDDYLVLEFIDGEPPRGPLPIDEVLRMASQVASALEAAHGRRIVHRDLKPRNILLTRDGVAKLLDFGVATRMPSETDLTTAATAGVLGTVGYMAPEQLQGRALDARADIFSFGAVLYELLSGRRAFDGGSSADVITAVLRDEPTPLETRVPELDRLVARCLAKDPSQRPQSITVVKRTLDDISRARGASVAGAQPSIAVLPFADMSPERDHEWFSDGLTEEIINALVQIPGLRVIARTSSFAFKGKQEDIRRIAEVLGVAHILEGSVRKAGDRIRVTAQLITAADGSHLWSERYDRAIQDVFAIQDEMAHTIASTLKIHLEEGGRSPGRHRRKPVVAAHEALLKARHIAFGGGVTADSMARSIDYVRKAIAIDPHFADAQAVLGLLFYGLAVIGVQPARDVVPAAKESLLRALNLEPDLPEAHALLGALAAMYDYDLREATRHFERSRARDSVGIMSYVRDMTEAAFLAYTGRPLQGIELIRRFLPHDPVNPQLFGTLGNVCAAAGQNDEAVAQYLNALELNERSWVAYEGLTIVRAFEGRFEEALATAETAHNRAPWNSTGIGMLAACLRRAGDEHRSRDILALLGDGVRFGAPIGFAIYHAINGDAEAGAEWLEKAIEQRDPRVPVFLTLATGPVWKRSTRWPALARTLGLSATV